MKWNALKKYDSWTFERILRHVLYWGLWSAFFVNLNYLVKETTPYKSWLLFELSVLPVKIACAYTVAYFLMPRFLYRKKYWAFILSSSASMVFFGYILYLDYKYRVYPIMEFKGEIYFNLEFFYKSLELVYITSLVVCIKFFQTYLHQEKVEHELRQEKTTAELNYLKSQIQPHFLFNTLNNLYGMVLSKDKQAPNTIVKLSEMLGYMLYDSASDTVLLKDELENLENYIALEKIRYDRKLDLIVNASDIPDSVEIAPMLLVPFVENAFKHGPAKEDGVSKISIDIAYADGVFTFKVDNSFSKDEMDERIQSGIGLSNVKKRLELIYPDKHTLTISDEDHFKIILTLKLDAK
ncbi:MAG: histidine kinase [Bacteroidota bacterium]